MPAEERLESQKNHTHAYSAVQSGLCDWISLLSKGLGGALPPTNVGMRRRSLRFCIKSNKRVFPLTAPVRGQKE